MTVPDVPPSVGEGPPARTPEGATPPRESLKTRLWRWGFNLVPVYRSTGARVTFIASDFREVRIRLPLNLRTRNYVGTIFGGSMFAAVDPFHMVMLIQNLGRGYVVWDKAAGIRFLRPGRETLYARFVLDAAEVEAIKAELAAAPALERTYRVDLVDRHGTIHAFVEKTIRIRRRETPGGRP